ncbi:MAG: hypothetical protein AAF799_07800 [Myxococcota bacterium]
MSNGTRKYTIVAALFVAGVAALSCDGCKPTVAPITDGNSKFAKLTIRGANLEVELIDVGPPNFKAFDCRLTAASAAAFKDTALSGDCIGYYAVEAAALQNHFLQHPPQVVMGTHEALTGLPGYGKPGTGPRLDPSYERPDYFEWAFIDITLPPDPWDPPDPVDPVDPIGAGCREDQTCCSFKPPAEVILACGIGEKKIEASCYNDCKEADCTSGICSDVCDNDCETYCTPTSDDGGGTNTDQKDACAEFIESKCHCSQSTDEQSG